MTERHVSTTAKKPVIQIHKGSKMRRFRASLTGDMVSSKKTNRIAVLRLLQRVTRASTQCLVLMAFDSKRFMLAILIEDFFSPQG